MAELKEQFETYGYKEDSLKRESLGRERGAQIIDWFGQEMKGYLENEIKVPEIKDLVSELSLLAERINENAGIYNSIVSDDASGRLVSLFLKKVLEIARKKEGLGLLKLKFVAGGRFGKEERFSEIRNFLGKHKEELGRVLLVTEYIESGQSIKNIINILNSLSIPFDLATLSMYSSYSLTKRRLKNLGINLYHASESLDVGVGLHGKHSLSGVERK